MSTQENLRQYILRQLGYPMHTIEITEEQLDDVIQNAFDRFNERHYNAVIQKVYKLDLIDEQNTYLLPSNIRYVTEIIPATNILCQLDSSEKLLIPLHASYNDYLWQFADITSIITYRMTRQTYENEISFKSVKYDFNYPTHKLVIVGDIAQLKTNMNNESSIFLLVQETGEEAGEFFNDRWFRNYASALAKRQWGMNLQKYSEIPLPGGSTLNADKIIDQADREIERLETELEDEMCLPPSFYVG